MFYTVELPAGKASGDHYWLTDCPFCGRLDKFSWNMEKNRGHCWSGNCGRRIFNYDDYMRAHEGLPIAEYDWQANVKDAKPVPINGMVDAWSHDKSRNWLYLKGFTEATSCLLGIKYHIENNELWIQIEPISSDLPKRWLRRPLWGEKQKWLHEQGCPSAFYGWNTLAFANSKRNVLVCEGLSDLAVTELYPDGIAMLGSQPNDSWFFWLKQNCGKVYYWFDADEAGKKAADHCEKMSKYYQIPYEIIRTKLDPKCYDPKASQQLRDFIDRFKEKIRCGL